MRIGLIDVDGSNFPNLPLMKISAWHKQHGNSVEWYEPFSGLIEKYDKVYLSKVFSFTPDYMYPIYSKEIEKGGTGYAIKTENGREIFLKENNKNLPHEIEHIFPDYSIYSTLTNNTAFGFLTRGCPRGCEFCHVKDKEGRASIKVADLSEFWNGQKNINLLDPNILACKDWGKLFEQLAGSGANVNFSQGLDIRLLNGEKAEALTDIKTNILHFAWDRYEDKEIILPNFEYFRSKTNLRPNELIVYVLCNFNTTIAEDLERIYTLRDLGYSPYVMLYDKEHIQPQSEYKKIQRWVNNRFIFNSVKRYEDYKRWGKE